MANEPDVAELRRLWNWYQRTLEVVYGAPTHDELDDAMDADMHFHVALYAAMPAILDALEAKH